METQKNVFMGSGLVVEWEWEGKQSFYFGTGAQLEK